MPPHQVLRQGRVRLQRQELERIRVAVTANVREALVTSAEAIHLSTEAIRGARVPAESLDALAEAFLEVLRRAYKFPLVLIEQVERVEQDAAGDEDRPISESHLMKALSTLATATGKINEAVEVGDEARAALSRLKAT